jgi:2-C-methyl-D-erythritol 2,4-cyclodiphosphate synthase
VGWGASARQKTSHSSNDGPQDQRVNSNLSTFYSAVIHQIFPTTLFVYIPNLETAQLPVTLAEMVHVGIGYDVHALVSGRKLILGGVEIAHPKGLDGHSDADVLLHAITDAILGALGEPDIGHFFPNTDPRWRGAASRVFLHEAGRLIANRQGKLVNIDATLIAQAPKIYPHIEQMKLNIAEALAINIKNVGIKATTNEHLGFIGREEGIAAMAVASVDLPENA